MMRSRRARALMKTALAAIAAAVVGAAMPASAQLGPQPIPRSELKSKCGLDPDIMAGVDNYLLDGLPYVVFRNGHYCWRSTTLQTELLGSHNAREVYSTTKSFGGLLVGLVSARSNLRDTSLLSEFLTPAEIAAFNPNLNPQARVAHVLAMQATSPNLAFGEKAPWSYDPLGDRELNVMIPLLNRIIAAKPANFWGATDVRQLAQKLFVKLGMTQTTWEGTSIGASLQSTPADLARLAELILRRGKWNGEVLVQERYLYRMTHPSFEDSNTGLGYLLWLNSATTIQGGQDANCMPYVRWPRYPHAPFFESPNSAGGFPFGDQTPTKDNGVVWSAGLNGSAFVVHRGLDMVMGINPLLPVVPPNLSQVLSGGINPALVWDNIRPALVAALPEFANNERGFCDVYRMGIWSQMREPWTASASY